MKKHKKILKELKRRKKANNDYLDINDAQPTNYMLGSLKELNQMIIFIENL